MTSLPGECECCFVDIAPESGVVICLAGHRFCKNCLKSHVEESAFGQNNYIIKCLSFDGKCDALFPDHSIRAVLPEQRVRDQFFHSRDTTGDFSSSSSGDAEPTGRELHHIIAERMTKIMLRHCPGCKKSLVKVGGCNHMKCPHCKTSSCYVCRKKIRFDAPCLQCPVFSSAEEDDIHNRDQLLQEMKKEAADRYADKDLIASLSRLGFKEKNRTVEPPVEVPQLIPPRPPRWVAAMLLAFALAAAGTWLKMQLYLVVGPVKWGELTMVQLISLMIIATPMAILVPFLPMSLNPFVS